MITKWGGNTKKERFQFLLTNSLIDFFYAILSGSVRERTYLINNTVVDHFIIAFDIRLVTVYWQQEE